jgi:hypothetical protein
VGPKAQTCALALLLLLPGCPQRKQPRPPDSAVKPDVSTRASTGRFEACTRRGGQAKPIMLERYKLKARGDVLWAAPALMARAKETRITLGLLADTKEALPATLARLDQISAHFKRRGVQAIVVLGGVAKSYQGVRAVLERLQRVAPVLALPGDRASREGFSAAAEAFPGRVVDLIKVRAVVLPGLTLVGVPGYHLHHHLLAKEQGCGYDGADLDALSKLVGTLPGPRILLAHGPPRGAGPLAVDRAFGQVNIGDPLLRRLMSGGSVGPGASLSLGVFGHVHESAGHATTSSGAVVRPTAWSNTLLLNVGSADSVPHQDLRGRWSRGSAAIIEVLGGRARYRLVRPVQPPGAVPRPTPAPSAPAPAKTAPAPPAPTGN